MKTKHIPTPQTMKKYVITKSWCNGTGNYKYKLYERILDLFYFRIAITYEGFIAVKWADNYKIKLP